MDKSKWADGPWTEEVDRLEFESHGLACHITRVSGLGHLCGYVGVPAGHPLYGISDGSIGVEVHGGVTFAEDECDGRSEGLWWIGFDCAHSGDVVPGSPLTRRATGLGEYRADTYRTLAWVRAETEQLAEQLARMKMSGEP